MRSRLSLSLCAAALLLSSRAFAVVYEADIKIEDEQDLYELNARGVISDEALEELVDLLRTGVDLNNANRDDLYELPGLTYEQVDRILAYRKLATHIDDPADLVRNQILTPEQLLQIAPFLVIREAGGVVPVTGRVRAVTSYTAGDPYAPPSFLQLRLRAPLGFTAGLLATTTRQRLGEVRWDDARQSLSATAPTYGFELPKFFVQWRGAQSTVIGGTYRVGFGERLTLDNTSRQTPDGIYLDDSVLRLQRIQSSFCRITGGTGDDPDCTTSEDNLYITPDFRWRTGFRGLAGHVENLSAGSVDVDLTGFASYQSRAVYQYAIYNTENCADPHTDNVSACAAPPVQLRNPNGDIATTRFTFQALPDFFNEAATGGNASLSFGPGKHLGLTGYYARPIFGANTPIDFQEYAPYPYGGGFGAVGIDGALSLEHLNLFAEASRSFDNEPQGKGGGYAVIQRSVYSFLKQELELSLRYYDRDYLNPYSRAISEPDRLDGQRVRNEA
ncbi:MAG: helix-hairpin-helix domain-containing protein, partial [Myxococcaceae bacterium]